MPDVHRDGRVPLNCTDPATAIIHEQQSKPSDYVMGRTLCGLSFTFVIYTRGYSKNDRVFTGTNEGASCLECIAKAQ